MSEEIAEWTPNIIIIIEIPTNFCILQYPVNEPYK